MNENAEDIMQVCHKQISVPQAETCFKPLVATYQNELVSDFEKVDSDKQSQKTSTFPVPSSFVLAPAPTTSAAMKKGRVFSPTLISANLSSPSEGAYDRQSIAEKNALIKQLLELTQKMRQNQNVILRDNGDDSDAFSELTAFSDNQMAQIN